VCIRVKETDVRAVGLTMKDYIDLMEEAHRDKGNGAVVMPPKLTVEPNENPEETPNEENPNALSEEEILAKIAEELGVIPEVGVNIMPCIFVGFVVSCTYLMYEVKKRMK